MNPDRSEMLDARLNALGDCEAASVVRYALGWPGDAAHPAWFLVRDFFPGNLMSTPDPARAHLWESPGAIDVWVRGLRTGAFDQIKERDLCIYPVISLAAAPVQRVHWFEGQDEEAKPEGPGVAA